MSVEAGVATTAVRGTGESARAALPFRHDGSHAARSRAAAETAPRLRIPATAETALAIAVVAIVALLVVPLPGPILDVCLALSFGFSIVVLLVVLSTTDPIDFSVFPSMLLLITLFRLGLNVASTRLILSQGHAGQVIAAFGSFVIGGNVVVGLVLFLILVVLNFVVITKGAGRIAEVAARFTLDAMPGRQMSIDADLSAGLIDDTEARRRREEISREADFYGAMEGAGKFVRGDAVAGLLITAINLVGGFLIGMTQRGLSPAEALSTYSTLTVGDGLVTQIPALIVSTAAGILVTYGSSRTSVGSSLGTQLTRNPNALWTVAGILALFAVIPGLPPVPFLALAAAAALVARTVSSRRKRAAEAAAADETPAAAGGAAAQPIRETLAVEPLELEIGYGLIAIVDEKRGGDLLARIAQLRRQLALDLGIVVPLVRVRDNIHLGAQEYLVRLRGVKVAGGEISPRQLLALDTTGGIRPLDGRRTTDPSFGIPAVWIAPERRIEAESAGYAVVDALTVLSTHLMETIRAHAAELLSRQDVRELLDGLKETHPSLVDDTVPARVPLGTLHRVMQRLVKEGIPVRDLVTILETTSDVSDQTKDPEVIAEHVRRALSLLIAQLIRDDDGVVRAIAVGPRLELALSHTFSPTRTETAASRGLDPARLTSALEILGGIVTRRRADGRLPALVTPPALRVGIRRLIEPGFPRLPVVSLAEIPPQTPVQTIELWDLPAEGEARAA